MKKYLALALAVIIMSVTACGGASKGTEQAADATIPYWTEGSAVADSIVAYVKSVTDKSSDSYVAPADRIAIFDFDDFHGT